MNAPLKQLPFGHCFKFFIYLMGFFFFSADVFSLFKFYRQRSKNVHIPLSTEVVGAFRISVILFYFLKMKKTSQ